MSPSPRPTPGGTPRIAKVYGAVNIGSFRVGAMIAGLTEAGELQVLGSSHRAAQGVKRGYVVDMPAATYAVRAAIESAEHMAKTSLAAVWVGCSGAGLASQITQVEIPIGGRRIEDGDVDTLLATARDCLRPDGRSVLHACPAHYTLDGAHGVTNPRGLHAERLGVDVHVMLADGAPVRNLTEAVQNAHLDVEGVVAAPLANGLACLGPEERELGVALIDFGAEVTSISVFAGGVLVGMTTLAFGSGDITDAVASSFGIRRFQAERLKCKFGSAVASPADHREMVPVSAPGEEGAGLVARHADAENRIPRAELIAVIAAQLGRLTEEIGRALKAMGFSGGARNPAAQVVITGGGAELAGLADYAQAALGRPVRIGRPGPLPGLPEMHTTPGFTTLCGLIQFAAASPLDVRHAGPAWPVAGRLAGWGLVGRVAHAMRTYF